MHLKMLGTLIVTIDIFGDVRNFGLEPPSTCECRKAPAPAMLQVDLLIWRLRKLRIPKARVLSIHHGCEPSLANLNIPELCSTALDGKQNNSMLLLI